MALIITCPDCKGQRQVYKTVTPEPIAITDYGGSTKLYETTYQRVLVYCDRCRGTGRAAATERIPVMQYGRRIGSVPPSFDPERIRSATFLYDPRPGDFVRHGDVWVANNMLGPGDLEAVPGFAWETT